MRIELNNRVALVIGASRGVGRAIALNFAEAGADVIVCGRDKERLAPIVQEVRKFGRNAYPYALDATKKNELHALFSKIVAPLGRLDILVNNLGSVEKFAGFFDLSEEDWMQSFRINVLAMVNASLEAIPWLKKSDQARIINIASLAARQIGKFLPHHAAAKAAMLVASKQLANILGKDNILVNAICPGTLHGEPWERGVKNLSAHLHLTMEEAAIKMEEDERAKTALGRVGAPQDVAHLAAFLASNYANWITGASYTIDGGASRSI